MKIRRRGPAGDRRRGGVGGQQVGEGAVLSISGGFAPFLGAGEQTEMGEGIYSC